MRSRAWLRFVAAVALVTGALFALLFVGCGSDNGLVGGSCAQGYAPCGSNCCPVSTDGSAGDGTMMTDGSDSSSRDGDGSGSDVFDAFGADRIGPGKDGATDGTSGDGTSGDGTSGDGTSGDGTGGDGSTSDGSGDSEAGITCMSPLVDCGGVCVDLTSDPNNCGFCFNVCASVICQMSMCVGTTAGGVVYAGHDYLTTNVGSAQARVLSNAVVIPQNSPLDVLSYERYANSGAATRVKLIVLAAAAMVGRTVNVTSTVVDADIPNKLKFKNFQVLIVHDQTTAASGVLAALGTAWASTLATFTQAGGIVIILDGGTGTGEMPALSTATGLLSVTAHAPLTTGTPLLDVAPGDAVGVGGISPYGAGRNSVTITTEASGGNVVYVIEDPSDAGPGLPVVVHKAF